MGGHMVDVTFSGSLTRTDLKKVYGSYLEDLIAEHGRHSHNGTLSTCDGLVIEDKLFDTVDEARTYIDETADKRGPAIAVKSRNILHVRDPFTFNGKPGFQTASPRKVESGRVVVADQLTPSEGADLTQAVQEVDALNRQAAQSHTALHGYIDTLRQPGSLPEGFFEKLAPVREQYVTVAVQLTAARKRLEDMEDTLRDKYCPERVTDPDPVWVVGGIAAC
jgi:hypothetical protein